MKLSGDTGHFEKIKPKNSRNPIIRIPAQKHRKYI